MRLRAAIVAGALSVALLGGARAVEPELFRAEVADDLDTLLRRIEEIHPEPWAHVSRADIEAERAAIRETLPDRVPLRVAHGAFRRITGLIGDGHVDLEDAPADPRFPDGPSLYDAMRRGQTVLPFGFDPRSDAARIGRIDGPDLPLRPGDRVVAIDGRDTVGLLADIERRRAGSLALKRARARSDLAYELWSLGLAGPFRVTLPDRVVTLSGLAAAAPPPDPVRYMLTDDRLGIVTLDTMPQDGAGFRRRLETIFERIAEDAPRALVIDLRQNAGGHSGRGEDLLDFLTDRPHRVFAEKRWKVSAACQRWLGSRGHDPDATVRRYLAASPGDVIHTPNPLRNPRLSGLFYRGPVAVLIGPETLSSGLMLANAIGDFGLATLVGRPTAEPATAPGEICKAVLPHSGVTMIVPSALLVRANGDATDRSPVRPDIVVKEDAGQPDPDLTAVRDWLLRRRGRVTAGGDRSRAGSRPVGVATCPARHRRSAGRRPA